MTSRFVIIALIVMGEALSIYAELLGAQQYAAGNRELWPIFLKMFGLIACAGGFLVLGYILGFGTFKNIWIVSVISMTSILVIEPFISYALFHQLPTRGALLGLGFGIIGSFCAMFL